MTRRLPSDTRYLLALLCVFVAVLAGANVSLAVQPDEVLRDAKLEARARKLSAELRCLVCQNQSIDDSDAPLAKDLRVLVRDRMTAGDTDRQIMDYIVARYGEFVLLRPRVGWHTALLWLAPILVLLGGGFLVWTTFFRTAAPAGAQAHVQPLSDEEQRRLEAIISAPDETGRDG